AADGIRYVPVTGVQTCALPIWECNIQQMLTPESMIYIRTYRASDTMAYDIQLDRFENNKIVEIIKANRMEIVEPPFQWKLYDYRSEERRVGKECRSRWMLYQRQ